MVFGSKKTVIICTQKILFPKEGFIAQKERPEYAPAALLHC